MGLLLTDMLTLVGRLSDEPGSDSGHARLRRFLDRWAGTLDDLRQLVADAQRASDDQSRRALGDLVTALGRHLGFVVTYGTDERMQGAVRLDGAWRSPRVGVIALEIRIERLRPFPRDDLARTNAALRAVELRGSGEEPIAGLRILVPMHRTTRSTDAQPEPGPHEHHVSVLSLETLFVLAGEVRERRMTHEQVVELFVAGADDQRVATLVSESRQGVVSATSPASRLSVVPRESPPDHWIATVVSENGATPEQIFEGVVLGRHVLGISPMGIFPASPKPGDPICFFLSGTGVVGHARVVGEIEGHSAPVRGADRLALVLSLTSVDVLDIPVPLDPSSAAQRLADRIPHDERGPFLTPISPREFAVLTAGARRPMPAKPGA
jgi:hypothetical protein